MSGLNKSKSCDSIKEENTNPISSKKITLEIEENTEPIPSTSTYINDVITPPHSSNVGIHESTIMSTEPDSTKITNNDITIQRDAKRGQGMKKNKNSLKTTRKIFLKKQHDAEQAILNKRKQKNAPLKIVDKASDGNVSNFKIHLTEKKINNLKKASIRNLNNRIKYSELSYEIYIAYCIGSRKLESYGNMRRVWKDMTADQSEPFFKQARIAHKNYILDDIPLPSPLEISKLVRIGKMSTKKRKI